MRCAWIGCLTVVLSLCAVPSFAAESKPFAPKVTDITVFKDGHALILARADTQVDDGWCRMRDLPAPLLGTFWTFVDEAGVQLDIVRAGLTDETKDKPCRTLDDFLRANVGRRVGLTEEGGTASEGELLSVPDAEPESARVMDDRAVPIPADTPLSAYVMLKTEKGTLLIQRSRIRTLMVIGGDQRLTRSETKKAPELALHLTKDGAPAAGAHKIGLAYMQKGIRWIPEYRVELLADGKARLILQGTLINDIVDFDHATVNLVVGVPSFIMQGELSPLALRDVGPQLSRFFQPPREEGGRSPYGRLNAFSNAIMTQQMAMPVAPRNDSDFGGPNVPTEGEREDLYIYRQEGVSLKKGERAVVRLMDVTVPYEDIYTWTIQAVPPEGAWRFIGSDEQRELAQLARAPKPMHKLRLTNSSAQPWTTGPAIIFRDGAPLGQQLMTYTSVKNTVELPVTVATDLGAKQTSTEIKRDRGVRLGDDTYTHVFMHGTLALTNFKGRPVRVRVEREVLGDATKSSEGTTIAKASMLTADEGAHVWAAWSWPGWLFLNNPLSTITWETTVESGKSANAEFDWNCYFHE